MWPLTQELDSQGNVVNELVGRSVTTAANTPLTVDLDGDGIETIGSDQGVSFDFSGNGNTMQTGWVGADDGILVRDLNNDGQITSGAELFGDNTALADGTAAIDGFQALAQFDGNNDGQINASDAVYSELKVWQDINSDGVVQSGEMRTAAELGIESFNLNAVNTDIQQQDNTIGLMSDATMTDGTKVDFGDVWFGSNTVEEEETN